MENRALKVGMELTTLSADDRLTMFRALAVQYIVEAADGMPTRVSLKFDGDTHDRHSDERYFVARETIRWLLVEGYLTSHERMWADSPYEWVKNGNNWRPSVCSDVGITDKGLAAINRQIRWDDINARKALIEAAKRVIGDGLEDAAKEKVGEMAIDIVGKVSAAFLKMFVTQTLAGG
ncbi:hypothetical protein [Ollibium composti]|uniref:Uncharacterized protein n=1 Tax=Ollibium composti TaxID=2675109 RepID=A0ABY2Q8F2_9HYPH|nr:hypothetical protein [Mesorhizobium composti]THF58143.1 hypothetical protein E6C48_05860 [Mesorhizobium composti]